MEDKKLLIKINFIEIYQIVGGVLGFLIMSYLFFTTNLAGTSNWKNDLSMICSFLFFAFCIYSGLLLNKKNYVLGFKLVFISLVVQLIAFDVFGLFYSAINGLAINLTLNLTNDVLAGFDFYPSHFFIALSSTIDVFIVKINLVAMVMLVYTSKVFQQLKD